MCESAFNNTVSTAETFNFLIDLRVSYPFECWGLDVLSCTTYWDVIVQVTRLLLECYVMLHWPDGWLWQFESVAAFQARKKQVHAMQQHLK
jgi:hypothetical protein